MSTRAVVYLHDAEESMSNRDYTMKLYHHYDWYIKDWLWEELAEMLERIKKYKENSNSWDLRALFEELAKVWWFEPTCWNHTDTEYIYHITYYYSRGSGFQYILEVQFGWDDWIESLKWRSKYVISKNWKGETQQFDADEVQHLLDSVLYQDE